MKPLKAFWKSLNENRRKIYSGPWYRKIVVWTATFIVSIVLFLLAVDCNFLWLFGRSPGFSDIMNPPLNVASEVYSADGVLMGKYFNELRTPVTYDEISPKLVATLISTEDERFYQHHGIDYTGLLAAVKDMTRGRARGASTITQQLAKNLFRVRTQYSTGLFGKIPGLKILVVKAKEWIVATKLEMVYDKEEILTMYFNTVDFGSCAFGIKTASKKYFSTTPDKITWEQAATLVGLLKATSTYNPIINPGKSLERRNVVLQNAFDHNVITIDGKVATQQVLDSLKSTPLTLKEQGLESTYDGIAPYFRQALVSYIDKLCEMGEISGCDEETKLDIYADGLKIYTTIDSRMQKYAEEACLNQMKRIQGSFDGHWGKSAPWVDEAGRELPDFIMDIAKKTGRYKYLSAKYLDNKDSIEADLNRPHKVKLFSYGGKIEKTMSTLDSIRYMVRFMHCGLVAMEPDTREVKAWVGDIDFGSWKYDKVTAQRQAGSTFKLFVYTEAMNQGMTPNSTETDSYISYQDTDANGNPTTWAPHNADGIYTNRSYTLKRAFAKSINTIAVKTGMKVGIHNIAETAHRMGIQSPLNETPSLSLGSSDVTLMELVNSYCTVVDDGIYNMPIMISRIEDHNGNVIYESKLTNERAIPKESADMMKTMLQGGMKGEGGTISSLWSWVGKFTGSTEFGGKTGTSNNHSDAWFVGVSPKLVGGVWVGGEYRCIHFRSGKLGQGSRTALPVFGEFIGKVLSDPAFSKYKRRFDGTTGYDIDFEEPDTTATDTLEIDSVAVLPEPATDDIKCPIDTSTLHIQ